MTIATFLSGSLSAAVAFLLIALFLALPLIVPRIRRGLISTPTKRRVIVVAVAVLAFLLIEVAVIANRNLDAAFSSLSTTDHYDYSALAVQVQHCTLDAVTCSLITKDPPVGTFDTHPWQYQVSSFITAAMAALFCAGVVGFVTQQPVNDGSQDRDSSPV